MDATVLARAQFAMTVMFHFLFPAVSIGFVYTPLRGRIALGDEPSY